MPSLGQISLPNRTFAKSSSWVSAVVGVPSTEIAATDDSAIVAKTAIMTERIDQVLGRGMRADFPKGNWFVTVFRTP
jgi:hypothetical protein